MRRLLTAAGIALAAGPSAAQLPPDVWFSPCGRPSATCISPQVSHHLRYVLLAGDPSENSPCRLGKVASGDRASPYFAEAPDGPTAVPLPRSVADQIIFAPPRLAPIADDARELLDRWELASRSHLPVTDAERLRLRYASPQRSGQELSLTCELQGPIAAGDLARRYDWTVTDDLDAVELTAVPKDRLDRLFVERFSVTLDAATWRPVSVRFTTRDAAGPVVALRPWVDEDAADVHLVGFHESENDAKPVRTAELSNESPRLLRSGDAPLDVPPAPAPCDADDVVEPVEAPKH